MCAVLQQRIFRIPGACSRAFWPRGGDVPAQWCATLSTHARGRTCVLRLTSHLLLSGCTLSTHWPGLVTCSPPIPLPVPVAVGPSGHHATSPLCGAGVRYRPPKPTMANARLEAEMVMFGAVADALKKTGLKPSQIGVLVVNCSLFNPTPSLAACASHHIALLPLQKE